MRFMMIVIPKGYETAARRGPTGEAVLLLGVRGDLLMELGRYGEAREELQRALAMTDNVRERDLLQKN